MKTSSKTLAHVISAIKNMRESKGSSSRDILSYISSIYDIPQDVAKRQMVAALKRGVAHGILRKSEGYYSLPTDTETECMEVAAQELGLLDLCCRQKKKRESRKSKSKGCGKKALRKKSKSRSKGCGKMRRRGGGGKKRTRSRKGGKKGCGCTGKMGKASRSKRRGGRSKSRCGPKKRSKRSSSKCKPQKIAHCKTDFLDSENLAADKNSEFDFRVNRRATRSKSRSCSRTRNPIATA